MRTGYTLFETHLHPSSSRPDFSTPRSDEGSAPHHRSRPPRTSTCRTNGVRQRSLLRWKSSGYGNPSYTRLDDRGLAAQRGDGDQRWAANTVDPRHSSWVRSWSTLHKLEKMPYTNLTLASAKTMESRTLTRMANPKPRLRNTFPTLRDLQVILLVWVRPPVSEPRPHNLRD